MHHTFQSMHTNPATDLPHKASITLASSVQLGLKNTGFTYNTLTSQIREGENGRYLDLNELSNNLRLNGRDYMHLNASFDAFAVSFRAGKNRFSVNITEHINARFNYNSSLLDVLVSGNTPGSTLSTGGYKIRGMHYREYGLGYNRRILEEGKMIVGGRIKLLQGMANVNTVKTDVSLSTAGEQDMYAITASSDILVRTAGSKLSENISGDYLLNFGNTGLGVDLGATYKYSNNWTFSASLINLGSIKWKEDVVNYQSSGEFVFEGIDNNDLFSGNFEVDQGQLTDSLTQIFEFTESDEAYRTALPAQMYLTAYYQLARNTQASATYHGNMFGGLQNSLALGITQRAGKWFQVGATYSMQARAYNNLGMGIIIGNGFQLYAMSDNILAFMQPGGARTAQLRGGFNFAF
ncbi:MAG: DUF5723 family protein [Cyclobacteriaceae bacterium]